MSKVFLVQEYYEPIHVGIFSSLEEAKKGALKYLEKEKVYGQSVKIYECNLNSLDWRGEGQYFNLETLKNA